METPNRSLETVLLDQRFIKRLMLILLSLTALLIVAHILFVDMLPHMSSTLSHQVDLDSEAAWSSWYGALVKTLAGIAAFLVAWVTHTRSEGRPRSHVTAWVIIGCIFIYLGFDDNSQIHETLAGAIRNLIEQANITQPIIYKYRANMWILVLGIPGSALMLYIIWFFKKNHILQNKRVRSLILAGAFLYLTYIGTEAVKNWAIRQTGIQRYNEDTVRDNYPNEWALFQVFVLIQESSEMIGSTLWMTGLLYYGASALNRERTAQSHLVHGEDHTADMQNPPELAKHLT